MHLLKDWDLFDWLVLLGLAGQTAGIALLWGWGWALLVPSVEVFALGLVAGVGKALAGRPAPPPGRG